MRFIVLLLGVSFAIAPLRALYAGGSMLCSTGAYHHLLIQPDTNGTVRATITNYIAQARQSICLTIYELEDQGLIDAMVAAKTANTSLNIRVIFNYASFQSMQRPGAVGSSDPNAAAKQAFSHVGIEWKNADPTFTVTHQKTFTFDNTTSIIMTFNLVSNYFVSVRDFGVITTDPAEVNEIVTVFDDDWATPIIPCNPPLLVWSPTNSREKITNLVASATQSIDVYMEEFSDYSIADALIAAAARMKSSGGTVRVITAVLSSSGSTGDGNLAMRQYLNTNGVLAKYGNWPIDPTDPSSPDMYIHAKMILADYGTTNAQAFVGSENFSYTSLNKNRELGIILKQNEDGLLLAALDNTFEGDWPLACYGDPSHPGTADFDGDGLDDPAVYQNAGAQWCMALSTASYAVQTVSMGSTDGLECSADYDGDRKADPAVYDAGAGLLLVRRSSQSYPLSAMPIGDASCKPVIGDFDGDGKADPALYSAPSGLLGIWCSNSGYTLVIIPLGGAGWLNASADYDGDGLTDPAVYRPQTGEWRVLQSSQYYIQASLVTAGGDGVVPAVGDFDGDGKADPTVFHPTTGLWLIALSSRNYATTLFSGFGGSAVLARLGDYDNDGKTDPAVYDPDLNAFCVWLSGSGYTPVILTWR